MQAFSRIGVRSGNSQNQDRQWTNKGVETYNTCCVCILVLLHWSVHRASLIGGI